MRDYVSNGIAMPESVKIIITGTLIDIYLSKKRRGKKKQTAKQKGFLVIYLFHAAKVTQFKC